MPGRLQVERTNIRPEQTTVSEHTGTDGTTKQRDKTERPKASRLGGVRADSCFKQPAELAEPGGLAGDLLDTQQGASLFMRGCARGRRKPESF